MYRTSHRIRKAGVAALVATLTVVSGLAFAPPAYAAVEEGELQLEELSQPHIAQNSANQAAGDLSITHTGGATDTLTANDVISIVVSDDDGNCSSPTDTIAFSAAPTITVTGTATVSAATLSESGATCVALAGPQVMDTVSFTVTGSGTATEIRIGNVTYTVGSSASEGPVFVNGFFNDVGPDPVAPFGDAEVPDASNAIITNTAFTANNPPTGATLGAGNFTGAPLVIREAVPGAGDGDFCIDFAGDDLSAGTLTVTTSGGNDTATATADPASDTIFVDVAPGNNAAPTTFTINGVQLQRDSTGVLEATLFADDDNNCANGGGSVLSANTTVGGVTNVERFGGSTRFTTAQILFEDRFQCQSTAIIARADLFPDALAASYLAGNANTGILLTNTDSIPAATLNALRNEGVENVYLMGGTHAISAAVAQQFDNTQSYFCDEDGGGPRTGDEETPVTLNVQRIGGPTRYETASLIAEYPGLDEAGDLDITPPTDADPSEAAQKTAIVALGENFPDALAAGPLAYNGDSCCEGDEDPIPLLLTRQPAVPATTMGSLADLGIENVLVMGGTVAVSDAAVAQLTAAGYTVQRIAGTTRAGTAVALVTRLINEWGFDNDDVALARGDDFPDSLTGGPWAGERAVGILLTLTPTNLSPETTAFISAWENLFCEELDDIFVFGGTVAIAASTVQAAVNAATLQKFTGNPACD